MTEPNPAAQVERRLTPQEEANNRRRGALAVMMNPQSSADLAQRAEQYDILPPHLRFAVALRETATIAAYIADSDFVPVEMRGKPEAVTACMLAGAELDLGPMAALRYLHIVKGKVGQYAEYMRARILAAGHEIDVVEASDTKVKMSGRRREWPPTKPSAEVTFTAQQAAKAKIDLGGYPEDKLIARATVRLARRVFADVIGGFAGVEELQDMTDEAAAAVADIAVPGTPAGRPRRPRRPAEPAPRPTPPPLTDRDPAGQPVDVSSAVEAVTPMQAEEIGRELVRLRIGDLERDRMLSLAVNRDVIRGNLDTEEAAHVIEALQAETPESAAEWLDAERDTVLPKPAEGTT